MDLPEGWKKVNFYSLHLSYFFCSLFVSIQVDAVKRILIKSFTENVYDLINAWVLVFFLVTSSGAGILGFIRKVSVKKIITILEQKEDDTSGS